MRALRTNKRKSALLAAVAGGRAVAAARGDTTQLPGSVPEYEPP